MPAGNVYGSCKQGGARLIMPHKREASMDIQVDPQTLHSTNSIGSARPCAHARIIDDILTRQGKKTGKVRCLECGATFDDPYNGTK